MSGLSDSEKQLEIEKVHNRVKELTDYGAESIVRDAYHMNHEGRQISD